MKLDDRLLRLLVEFFDLPPETLPGDIKQESVAGWDSLAMVQLITELERTFSVEFDIEEIQRLQTYAQIRDALSRKNLDHPPTFPV